MTRATLLGNDVREDLHLAVALVTSTDSTYRLARPMVPMRRLMNLRARLSYCQHAVLTRASSRMPRTFELRINSIARRSYGAKPVTSRTMLRTVRTRSPETPFFDTRRCGVSRRVVWWPRLIPQTRPVQCQQTC